MPKEDGGFDLRSTASNSVIIIGVARLVHDILKDDEMALEIALKFYG